MTFAATLTLLVIAASLAAMVRNVATPDLVLLTGVVVLMAAGVITPTEAFSGFSNTGMLTVAMLFVVAAGLRETGIITQITSKVLGRPRHLRGAVARMVVPTIAASAFLNNTTIVAMLLPGVIDWAKRIGVSPSKLLMPLSFATIAGGTCTLIGTSTNLVVAGLIDDLAESTPGMHSLSMFEITPIGIPVALAAAVVLIFLAPLLLPDREKPVTTGDDPRGYTGELVVQAGGAIDGKTVDSAGLRHLPGAFLMEIVRDNDVLSAVENSEKLKANDRLVFVGDVEAIVDLQRTPGLAAAPDQVFKLEGNRSDRKIVEAVVSHRHPLVGTSVRDSKFRTTYQAVIIAVARAGERVRGRIGDIVLKPGDVLLLEARPSFLTQSRVSEEFYMVSAVEGATTPRLEKSWIAGVILALLVGLGALEVMHTVVLATLAAGAMVATGCLTLSAARRSLDPTVLVAIAASFGIGEAINGSGLAQSVAHATATAGVSTPMAALVAVYLVTATLTEMITNNAAAVLAAPIAVAMAAEFGVSPMPFLVAVMFAASASFLTPIGYQTNLMVYNAGGYKFTDYVRLGLPITIAVALVTLTLIPLVFPLAPVP